MKSFEQAKKEKIAKSFCENELLPDLAMFFALDNRVYLDEFEDKALEMAKEEYESKKDKPEGMIHKYILDKFAHFEEDLIEFYLYTMYFYRLALKSGDKLLICHARDDADFILRCFEEEKSFQGKQAIEYFHKIVGL